MNANDIDPEDEKVEEYLAKFKSTLMERLQMAIDSDLQNDPDCVKGRKKTVQVRPSLALCFLINISTIRNLSICAGRPCLGNIPRAFNAFDVPAGAPTNG